MGFSIENRELFSPETIPEKRTDYVGSLSGLITQSTLQHAFAHVAGSPRNSETPQSRDWRL